MTKKLRERERVERGQLIPPKTDKLIISLSVPHAFLLVFLYSF